jgi:hydantoinase/carbamoylase family amidase
MFEVSDALQAAAQFGVSANGGVSRFAWTHALFDVYAWLQDRAADSGFSSRVDPAGNLIVEWNVGDGPAVAIGSHLDTVPSGGRFDGALGVLAGFEAMRLLKRRGFRPRSSIWLVAFMDEEGARFNTAMFGSRAFAGEDVLDLSDRRDAKGVSLAEAMVHAGFSIDRVPEAHAVDRLRAYLELHIEQGPVLERSGTDVGVVTGISGLRGVRVSLTGEAAHSGTTPLEMRQDALVGASRAVLEVRDLALRTAQLVATVGTMRLEPGAFNVVAGMAEFNIDIRSVDELVLDAAEASVEEIVRRIADEEGLGVALSRTYSLEPLALDEDIIQICERAAVGEGASFKRMPSGAGHDAMVVGRHVAAGMLFVPSRNGVSHNPAEETSDEDCETGTRVLARAIESLSG